MDPKSLKDIPLFGDLSRRERRQLAQWMDEIEVDEGTRLATEGDFAHEFFVIEEGTAEVTQGDAHLRDMNPGDFFGEIALLDEEKRTATVTATSPMRLIVMFQTQFRSMSDQIPEVAAQLQRAIQERWRDT